MTPRLNSKVRIYRDQKTPDGGGGYSVTPVLLLTLNAEVKPLTGREGLMARQLEASMDCQVTVRRSAATAGILASDTLEWAGRQMQIRAISDAGQSALYLTLMCESGVAT